MSMKSWSVNGYGIDSSELNKIDKEQYLNWIKNNYSEEYKECMEDLELENSTIATMFDSIHEEYLYSSKGYGDCGIYYFIMDKIREETGIELSYDNGEDSSAIALVDRLPWHYNEVEKNLNKDKLDCIFHTWFDSLLKEGEQLYIGRTTVEFYG